VVMKLLIKVIGKYDTKCTSITLYLDQHYASSLNFER
jgi:hypothetical protein